MPEHIFLKYSLTSNNTHLSETATFLANNPYIDFCLYLSTTATSLNNVGQPQYYKII